MALRRKRPGLDQYVREQEENTSQLPLRCMFCCSERRLQSLYELSKGDHIKQPGENLSHNIGRKLKRFYYHHAIVKEVHQVTDDGSSAILTLIEFMTSPFDTTPKIREQTVLKNLQYDEVYLIKYRHETHTPDEIISRGERLIGKNISYNLLFRNCEHVARWCVCGSDVSFQAEGFFENANMFLRFLNNYILRIAAMTIDDFLLIGRVGAIGSVPIAGPIVLLVIILQQLLKAKNDSKVLAKLFHTGGICESCLKRRKREVWAKFAVLFFLQTGGLAATSFLPCVPLQILFGIIMSILTVTVMSKVPKLMRGICSPFVGRKCPINSFRKVWLGDVISWKVGGFYHDGIVAGITDTARSHKKKANINVIHYSTPGIFTKGKIVEETISVDLNHDELRVHDYTGYDYNKPEVVVDRARKRLGETKFGLTNRSAHFCHWAKLKDTKYLEMDAPDLQHSRLVFLRPLDSTSDDWKSHPLIINHRRTKPVLDAPLIRCLHIPRPTTSKEIEKVKALIRDDIEPGQLVQFTYRHFPHQAVCTEVRPGSKHSVVHLKVVHYGEGEMVKEEMIRFDLNKVNVTIVKIHPLYKFNKRDIIRRARARVGEMGYNLLYHRSSHLAEEIVCKDKDQRVASFSQIKPGDCISYKYWKLPHDAVVVGVAPSYTKGDNEGHITLVHYALDTIFGTRYVKMENIKLNLLRDWVLLKAFPGCVVYPDEVVVQRALSRVGERKFHLMGNISTDLVQWAKVVQTPCIVTVCTTADGEMIESSRQESVNQSKEFLLIPIVGDPYERYFQRDWIKTWDELTPGIIARKDCTVGILSKVVRHTNVLKIIQNVTIDNGSENGSDQHIGQVKEIAVKVDLCTEHIYVYRCDPRYSNRPEECVRKARQLLGSVVPDMGEWGFCKDCVVKH